ncbi:MAG: hypothetical protein WBO08_03505 [Mycobacterium sp.]|nr:hypothetical protein [Mycobacterium sp.]
MTSRLWKRNVVGAVVAAAALAAYTPFNLQPAWERYERTVQPAHLSAPGEPIIVDGQTWTVRDVSRSSQQDFGGPLPDGTGWVNILVERSGPAAAGFPCTGYLVDGERSWRASGPPCGDEVSMPWRFFVPASAEPEAVDIIRPDGSLLIRLQL